jgi:hypothetical protein
MKLHRRAKDVILRYGRIAKLNFILGRGPVTLPFFLDLFGPWRDLVWITVIMEHGTDR